MTEQNNSGIRYQNLERDPIRAITDALVMNLGEGNIQTAKRNYTDLRIAIGSRGNKGKDIRYARKELNILAGNASEIVDPELSTSAYEIGKQATSYVNQLPNPSDSRRENGRPWLTEPAPDVSREEEPSKVDLETLVEQ